MESALAPKRSIARTWFLSLCACDSTTTYSNSSRLLLLGRRRILVFTRLAVGDAARALLELLALLERVRFAVAAQEKPRRHTNHIEFFTQLRQQESGNGTNNG